MAQPDINQLLAQAASSPGAVASTGNPDDTLQVFMGTSAGSKLYAGKTLPDGSVTAPSDHINIQGAAKNLIYSWSAAQRKKWEQQLLDAGLIKPGQYNFADLVQMWQGAVEGAAALYTHGQKKVTPQQYVKNFLGVQGAVGSGPTTTTHTDKTVQHFDDTDARGIALDEYQSELGRAASPDEVRGLQKALNAFAANHPAISTRTTTTDANGNSTSTNTSKGGVNQAGIDAISQERIQQKPEYASYQAATTYMNALDQDLGGISLGVMGV